MAKIVIDARMIRTSTGRYVERLLFYLQQIDRTNDYVVLLKPKDIEGWRPTNRKFTKVSCPFKEFTFAEQIGLLAQLKKLKADLTHFSMVQQPVLYRGRVVTTIHDLTTARFRNPTKSWLVFTLKQQVYRWVNKIAARKSAAIITPSQYVKDDVAKFARINSRKITVTYEGADKVEGKPQPIDELVNQPFILYVGRPFPHKNLVRLIAAFVLLKQKQPDLKLVLVGKTDTLYKRLQKRADSMEATDIIFTGFVSEAQLKWLYKHTLAYVFPSISEGFGLPGIEAMVEGAPVLASNVSCLPEIYGEAAHYFDPYDISDMSSKINQVLTNSDLRKKLITKGHKQANKYSWQKMAEQTLAVYDSVLEET